MYQLGLDPTAVRTSAEGPAFALGTRMLNQTSVGPKEFVYVQMDSSGLTGAGYVALIASTYAAVMATTTTSAPAAGQGKLVGVGAAAIGASGYGWVQVYGQCAAIRVAASCAAYTTINTTATAGQLDDDATVGAEVIEGLVLNAANGGAAGTVAGMCTYPVVGRTL